MADLVVDVNEAAVRESALRRAAERVDGTKVGRHLSTVAAAVPGGRLAGTAGAQAAERDADRLALEQLLRAHAAAARGAAEALVEVDLRLLR